METKEYIVENPMLWREGIETQPFSKWGRNSIIYDILKKGKKKGRGGRRVRKGRGRREPTPGPLDRFIWWNITSFTKAFRVRKYSFPAFQTT